jgi:N-acetyl sugar amidotransferase
MKTLKYCKGCFMPSSRPRIQIDENGYCNGCIYNKNRKTDINWDSRKLELAEIVRKSKTETTNKTYDCVIGWSGGKDSSAVALRLKKELGLNPLLVTFSPLIPTPEGEFNRRALQSYGFDSILVSPNIKVSKYLSKRFFIERGDPKVHWNAGINAATINIASALNIPIIFYAEHGESEYGGRVLSEENTKKRTFEEILENQIGDDPLNWVDNNIDLKDLDQYLIDKTRISNLQILYFAYYFPWDIVQNLETVEKTVKFQRNMRGRTYGTFTDFDSLDDTIDDLYYYMQFIKFGFGRCLRDCARQIQRGRINRNDAFQLISMYDGEFPEMSIDATLDFLEIDRVKLDETINLHRRSDIWEKTSNEWKLIYPLLDSDI